MPANEWDETSESADFIPSPVVFVVDEDGIPTPTYNSTQEISEATPETLRCLHGPCDYYAERRHTKPATAGGVVTTIQRYCRAITQPIPTEFTDLSLSVCSRHHVDGKECGDRAELLAMRSDNYCRGCNYHSEVVMPDPDDPDDDEILDFCRLLNSSEERGLEALTFEVQSCTLHTAKKGTEKDA